MRGPGAQSTSGNSSSKDVDSGAKSLCSVRKTHPPVITLGMRSLDIPNHLLSADISARSNFSAVFERG